MAFSSRGALRRGHERDDFSIVRASRSGAWGAPPRRPRASSNLPLRARPTRARAWRPLVREARVPAIRPLRSARAWVCAVSLYGLRYRSVGCVLVQRPRLLPELRRTPDDRARSASRRSRAPAGPGSTMGPEPSLRASLSTCVGSPPLPRGARGLHACTSGPLPKASQGLGSPRRPHGYGHGHPALWRRAEPERALPHAGGRWGLRARAGRLAFLRSRQSAHRRGGRHPARCHSRANPAPARATGLVAERTRRGRRRTRGAAIARALRRVRPSTGRHGTTRRCNGAPPRRRANGEARSAERSATSPPRWFRPSRQHLGPCQEPAQARAPLPVSPSAAGSGRPVCPLHPVGACSCGSRRHGAMGRVTSPFSR